MLKRLFLTSLLCLLALPAGAFWQSRDSNYDISIGGAGPGVMTTPVFSIGAMVGSGSLTYYGTVQGAVISYSLSTVSTFRRVPIPISGTLFGLNTAAGYAQTCGGATCPIVTSNINGSNGTVSCTWNSASPYNCNSGATTDAITAGDLFQWQINPNGSAFSNPSPSTIFSQFSFLFTSSVAQQGMILIGPQSTNVTTTSYLSPGSGINPQSTDVGASAVMPTSGNIAGIYALPNGSDNNAGVTHTYSVCKNGSTTCAATPASGVFCANPTPTLNASAGCCANVGGTGVIGSGGPSCSSITAMHVSAGDTISVIVHCASTCSGVSPGIGLIWVPDTTNQVPIFAGTSAVGAFGISDRATSNVGTYNNVPGASTTMTFSNLTVCTQNAVNGTQSLTDTVQSGVTGAAPGSATSMVVNAVPATPNFCSASPLLSGAQDSTHTFSGSASVTMNHLLAVTGAGSGLGFYKQSMVATVP